MASVTATGAYVPFFYLSRDEIAAAWGRHSLGGSRAVANHDEDSLTMAVEAATDCLAGVDRQSVDALYFASTTAPYREKQTASLIAAALDLREDLATVDFGNSLRCASGALQAAFNAVKAGSARSVLVVAADCRLGYPRSDQEQAFGEGAAAVLVTDGGAGASLETTYSCTDAIMDVWRKEDDSFVRSWEERWVTGEGWMPNVTRSLKGVLEKAGVAMANLDRLVLAGAGASAQARLTKGVGFPPERLQDGLANMVGDTGAAHMLLCLVGALRSVEPPGRIAAVAYGDGADALLFKVQEKPAGGRRGVEALLSARRALPNYVRYLAARNLVEIAPGEPFRLAPSASATWRDEGVILRCHASRCRRCGTVAFPIQRVCVNCRAKDDFSEVRLADERGTVFTYSIDNVAGRGDDPTVVQTVVEMDETKARFYAMMTDCDPKEVRVGMPVELTFRRVYEGAGFYNYFWKCRPVRGEGA